MLTMEMCEQCGGAAERLYLSPRGSICKHCVNNPGRGPDCLKTEYPELWERYKE